MIDEQAKASEVQPPLICREVVQVLRDVVLGRLQMVRGCEQSWDESCLGLLLVQVDTWMLAFNINADELDYCERCEDASGRRWSFDSSSRHAGDPIELLSTWEYSELERKLRSL